MLKYYIADKDLTLFDDCSLSANAITEVKANTRFNIKDSAGEWKYVKTEKNDTGWVFSYLNSTKIIKEDEKTGDYGIHIGDIINIDDDAAFVKDYYGHILTIKNGYNPVIFQVENIVMNPMRVEFKNADQTYSFTMDKIKKFKVHGESDYANGKFSLSTFAKDDKDPNSDAGETDENKKAKEDHDSELSKLVSDVKNIVDNLTSTNEDAVATNLNAMEIDSLQGVFGMPYQFMPIADMRVDDTINSNQAFGRKYAEKIVARMPLLIMTPGVAKFMAKYSSKERESVIQSLVGGSSDDTSNKRLDTILSNSGQYYNFYADWVSYYKYVNPLCRIASVLMKINDITIPDGDGGITALGKYNWSRVANDKFRSTFAYKGGCAFYLNADSQVSESYSNETTKTELADKINSVSAKVRELQFLMGSVSAAGLGPLGSKTGLENAAADKKKTNTDDSAKGPISNMLLGSNNILGSIANGMGEVIQGSKMRFPELWADSQFSKDYSISIKLVSPDCDQLSLYLNIIVPLIHLMCLAAPRSTGVNSYNSPFLVRAFYRGFFNINTGMITSMSITKGGEGKWSYANIPTEVDVNITIKDLYDMMAISMNNADNFDTDVSILSNNTLMDYLSNMVGVNINEIDVVRTLTLYKIIAEGKINDFLPNLGASLDRWAYNKLIQIFNY